jgi:hypothetical protein
MRRHVLPKIYSKTDALFTKAAIVPPEFVEEEWPKRTLLTVWNYLITLCAVGPRRERALAVMLA